MCIRPFAIVPDLVELAAELLPSALCRRLAFALFLLPAFAFGQTSYMPYTITTLAGLASPGSTDGMASAARFRDPTGVATGPDGSIYVADTANHTIRKIAPDGTVTTLAGLAGVQGSADGTGSAARFYSPQGVAADAAGNVYAADTGNHAIREITPSGLVTTLAGSAAAHGTADGIGSAAKFEYPHGLAIDAAGNLFVSDSSSHTIRQISPNGTVTTLAGSPGLFGSADGVGGAARFYSPQGLAIDGSGNLFVADASNDTIRKVTSAGVVTTLAGSPKNSGSIDGVGSDARFYAPDGLTLGGNGTLYVGDTYNHTIRKITPDGTVTTLAGLPGAVGVADGTGSAARFDYPEGLAIGADGSILVADRLNNAICRVTTAGAVTTLAGIRTRGGSADGTPDVAQFSQPYGIAVDRTGTSYVADTANHTIRKVAPTGTVTTLAGLAGVSGSDDGTGSAARFNAPQGIAIGSTGSIYVADTGNHTVRKLTPDGLVTTVAGSAGNAGNLDGPADTARFSRPNSLAVDGADNIYVLDSGNAQIRKINPSGNVISLSLSLSSLYSLGLGGIAVDAVGDLYGTMAFRHEGLNVFKFTPAGVLSAVGPSVSPFYPDTIIVGLTVDGVGNVYIAYPLGTIYRLSQDGTNFTLAGMPSYSGYADAVGTAARFDTPRSIAVDAAGVIYVADTGNNAIRKGQPYPFPVVTRDPTNRMVTAGQDAVFSVVEGSSFPATLQWQRLRANSTTWVDLRDDGVFSGTTTITLTVHAAAASMNGDSFRCVVTNNNGSATSAPAVLGVLGSSPLTVTTLAGQAGSHGSTNGIGSAARFYLPADVAVDHAGNVYVADTVNHTIRKIAPDATVTTLAGTPTVGGYADGPGASALFANPAGVALDRAGFVYVSDTDNSVIRKITPAGVVSTLAGTPHKPGTADGAGSAAGFNGPSGIVVDAAGNVYVADTLNQAIRKITPEGLVSTLAGAAYSPGHIDGIGSAARFWGPQGLALDAAGNLYVADSNLSTIRKVVLATATVTTVASRNNWSGSDDGPATTAQFNNPSGIAVDNSGNLYVADTDNHTIRQITPAGVVTTIAGLAGVGAGDDGVGTVARFNYPTGIAVDDAGNLYIADTNNHTIRLAYFSGAPVITSQPQSQTVTAGASVQFTVGASGRPTPTCQWYVNGTAISGATSSSLSVGSVQSTNAGDYTVTVSNNLGSVTSSKATLTVNAASSGGPSSSGGGGGGGAMGPWFAAALVLMQIVRWTGRREKPEGIS
jgi:sugar lactone lactonase YvrE